MVKVKLFGEIKKYGTFGGRGYSPRIERYSICIIMVINEANAVLNFKPQFNYQVAHHLANNFCVQTNRHYIIGIENLYRRQLHGRVDPLLTTLIRCHTSPHNHYHHLRIANVNAYIIVIVKINVFGLLLSLILMPPLWFP